MTGGGAAGALGAVYLPVGWVPLLGIAGLLAFTRYRAAVVTPRPPRQERPVLSMALH